MRRLALGAAVLALPACGWVSPAKVAHRGSVVASALASDYASGLDGVTQSTPLDGVTQSTPLDQILTGNPLRTDLPPSGADGGSLSGIVQLEPGGTGRSTAAIAGQNIIQGSAVYLETPDSYIYVQDGTPLVTPVDAQGHFSFGSVELPKGTPVIAGALLMSQGSLQTCVLVQSGINQITIDAASTFFGRYLQHQAQSRNCPITDFDPSVWPSLIDLTSQAMTSGCLKFQPADLAPMSTSVAQSEYEDAMLCDPALASAWSSLLGPVPAALPPAPSGPLPASQWSRLNN